MEGFIKITATETGIATEVKLAHISVLDKILMLNAFARGLEMDDKELGQAIMILPLARGLMSNGGDDEEEAVE